MCSYLEKNIFFGSIKRRGLGLASLELYVTLIYTGCNLGSSQKYVLHDVTVIYVIHSLVKVENCYYRVFCGHLVLSTYFFLSLEFSLWIQI